MATRSWIRRLFARSAHVSRSAASPRPSCRPQVTALEDRLAPATLTEAGTTLTVNLDNLGEQVVIAPGGGGYALTSNFNFVDGGITAGNATGLGTTSATVTAAGLAAYDTIRVIDSANDTAFRFRSGTYSDDFTVTLDDDADATGETTASVTFDGFSIRFDASDVTVATTRNAQFAPSLVTRLFFTSGNLSVQANAAGATLGDFIGIRVSSTQIQSDTGNVTLSGRAGGTSNGVVVSASTIQTSAGTISLTGTAGAGAGQFGVALQTGGVVTTQGGSILIDGKKSSGGLGGDVQLNGAVSSAGGDIDIQADRDIIGNASGTISSGTSGGTINVIADQDHTGTPNDAGTIQLAGAVTAGSGLGLHLTDTDGVISGAITSAGGLTKLGTGTLQLTGASTVNGLKTVEAGTLLVNGSVSGTGTLAVDTAGTLGGTGSVAGHVLVLGTITGGTVGGAGTLTVGSLSFDGGTYRADVKNTTSDTLAVSGAVDLRGTAPGSFVLNYTGSNTPAGTVFTLIDNTGGGAIVDPPLAGAPEGGTVPIKARVGTYTYAGGTGNDFTLAVAATADVQITKTGPANPVPGANVTYTLTVTNGGPDTAQNVGVVDIIPTGTTFVSLSQTSGPTFGINTPAVGGTGSVVLTAAALAPGDSATFTLVVDSDPSLTGTLSNTAQVATTTTDSDPGNNSSTATGTLLPQADLQITKTGPATVLSGQNVTYSLTVTNAGASDAQTVAIADPLPAGTTFVSLTQDSGPAFTPFTPAVGSGGSVVLTATTLAAGATATFTLVVNVGAAVSGPLANTAQITSLTADPNTTNNLSTVTTTALVPDDLQIHKSAPAKVDPGANLTYTITVANTGLADALTLVVADAIPANTTFVSLTQTYGTAFDNVFTPAVGGTGTVVLNTATFAAGAIATFTLVVNVSAGLTGGTITNNAQVTSTTPDLDPSNNSSTTTTAITQSDLTVSKNGPATVTAGQDLTYTITLGNAGPDAATNVSITDAIPAGTTFVSLTQNAGAGFTTSTPAVGSGGTVTISTPSLAVGSVATFTLVVRVPAGSSAGGSIVNTATGTSLTPDTDPSNSFGTVTTTVVTQADIQVGKTGPTDLIAGQDATYTITVSNTGPSDAQVVSVADVLPAGTTFVSLTQTAGPAFTPTTPAVGANGTVTLSAATLAAGASATFTLVVRVAPAFTGPTLTNAATGTTATTDPNAGNDTGTVTSAVTTLADIQVTKTAPATVTAGQNLTYTITVSNAGPSDAQVVSIADVLPAGTTFVSLTQTAGPTFNSTAPAVGSGGNLALDASTLAAGATATFTLVVAVDPLASGTLSNTATGTTTTTDATPGNDAGTATTSVDPLGDLRVGVTADKTAAFPGDVVTYTIVVTNLGLGSSPGVTVSVPFAADLGGVAWTAVYAGGATGGASGSGAISQQLDLPAGASVTYTVAATVLAGRRATIPTVAQVIPGSKADPDTSNNSATASVVRAPEVVVVGAGAGGAPHVKVYAALDGRLVRSFFAYAAGFAGGVTVAQGDVTGDGVNDIVTGAGAGGAPHVKVFDGVTGAEVASFYAYDSGFRDGVYVAAGDVDGDGRADVITGAGVGGAPHVKVFAGAGLAETASFFAYDSSFRGGVTVAAGDVDGDGLADVVTGAGPGGAPHVKVFAGPGLAERASFLAYREVFPGGVFVAVGDINGDGIPDVVTGAGPTGGPRVRAFTPDGNSESLSFFDTDVGFGGGVRVAATDYDGDGVDDLVTGTGPGGASLVKRFRGSATISGSASDTVASFAPFDAAFTGGVFVG